MTIHGYSIMRYRERRFTAQSSFTLKELARETGCHPQLISEFTGLGIVEAEHTEQGEQVFSAAAAMRLGRGLRLRQDLKVSVDSLPLVLDLLERIDELEAELARLRRQAEGSI